MFERTFSFWRRLVGKSDTATAQSGKDERRLWVRYPADIRTNIHLNGKVAPQRIAVEVRDISQGGAQLVMSRPLEAGTMLSLELPADSTGASHEVLACVVRVHETGQGQWTHGCVFSRELTEHDLEGLGAQKVKNKHGDQRLWQRFPSDLSARFQRVGGAQLTTLRGQVINLSPSGIGLLVPQSVDPGTLWTVELVNSVGTVVKTILACVVHVAGQEGSWSLGLNFIRQLAEEDVQAILTN